MGEFVHLHLHSEYSLLDGACRIADIPMRAKQCGHTAVALTDHGVMYGAVAFYRACMEQGVRPILGCEVYVAPESRFDKSGQRGQRSAFHLVLLCKNEVGYRNLLYLVSKAFTDGFYSKPRIDMELLSQHTEGLIGLSACLAGQIPQQLLLGDFDGAVQCAKRYAALFAPGDFYIEIQDHGLAEQRQILPELVRLSKACDLPLVATNDCHYLTRDDADKQAVLMCIQTNTCINDGRPVGFETDEFYYKTTEEMEALFAAYPEALDNTVRIAEKCQLTLDLSAVHLPHYPCPDGVTSEQYLRRLTEEGLQWRLAQGLLSGEASSHTEQEYRDRLDYELSVIVSMGYADYFLIVADYVRFAKQRDIPVGPGRGSGAGSLVAFMLGITDVDSIAFDLLFERFLNPERVSMPDIDIDFCYNRRDEVIAYVTDKYGADHVSQIVTFGTLAARAAVRDVGRAQGLPYGTVDLVARAIPRGPGVTIEQARQLPELKALYEQSEETRRLIDTAQALEGMPRNISVHAAGVLITEEPLFDFVPLALSNDTVVSQYDMDTLSQLGLLKFDFLALRYLTVCHDAELQIREHQPDFRLEAVPLTDRKTYELISAGDTGGVFQLESAGMRQMLSELRPQSIDDVQAAIALYRPGPMDSIPQYIENRKHPERITYATPQLAPILSSTYGCVVYQEQVMSIFRTVAGYTFGHADVVRRAMSKKKAAVLEAERESFVAGAEANGVSQSVANQLFDDMADFANYAFNKSHAAAYALISYRTAYLKAHYPREYMAALLTSVLGKISETGEYIAQCQRMGIAVFPPHVNHSHAEFHVSVGQSTDGSRVEGIRYGLLALKNVGKALIDAIVKEREQNGPFASPEDFVHRISSHDLNKRQVEALIKAGAFDGLGGVNRRQLMACYEQLIDRAAEHARSHLEGQLDMFSTVQVPVNDAAAVAVSYPTLPDFSLREKLMQEKEASGMYFSGQLLDGYSQHLERLPITPINELLQQDELGDYVAVESNARVTVAGVIRRVSVKNTRGGEQMAFFSLEDRYAEMECLVFPKLFETYRAQIAVDAAVCVEGSVSYRENEPPKLLLEKMVALMENDSRDESTSESKNGGLSDSTSRDSTPTQATAQQAEQTHVKRLYLRVPDTQSRAYRKALNLAEIFEGNVPIVFYDKARACYLAYRGGVALSDFILQQFIGLLGEENVIYQ